VKVVCLQEQLHRALGQVSRAVATRTTLPILGNVLLIAEEDELRIQASNLEIAITTAISASVEEGGRLTVDARLLNDFVATLPNENVTLQSDRGKTSLTVQSGRDHADINGLDADDFPVIKSFTDEGFALSLDAAQLREIISQVELAAASDDSRPVLAGVLFRFEDRSLTLAAADGFRLAVRTGELAEGSPDRVDIIVPARAVRELSRIIGDINEPIRMAVTPNRSQLLVKAGPSEFLTQLIEGTFPDYKQIIPKDFSTKVELGRDAFGAAVRRASYFARDNNDVIRLHVRPGESESDPGTVEVTANAVERGNSQSFLDAGVTGPELEVAFNARYLTDVLGVVKTSRVLLGLNGANQAGVVRVAGSDDYSHVIMPMVIGAN